MTAKDIDVLIYAGVCREQLEPATACHVAAELGISSDATIYDVSNACLGVLNGIVEVANRIELGQAKAGLVVSCETSREINEVVIDQMVQSKSMDVFKQAVATLTGGSGAVAVLVVDKELSSAQRRQLLGGADQERAAVPQSLSLGLGERRPDGRSNSTHSGRHAAEVGV